MNNASARLVALHALLPHAKIRNVLPSFFPLAENPSKDPQPGNENTSFTASIEKHGSRLPKVCVCAAHVTSR